MKKSNKMLVPAPRPKAGEIVRPRQERNDGWQNLVTMLGTSADKRSASTIKWDNHPPEFYEQLYSGGGIAARIVDLIPDESLRKWVDWTNVNNDQKERIEDRCQELDLRGNFLKAWKWGRAYGGGLLHIVILQILPLRSLEERLSLDSETYLVGMCAYSLLMLNMTSVHQTLVTHVSTT